MVSVLCKSFGLNNIELAQDLVSETFLKASETWGLKGVPENPRAWLYAVAKNRTKDHFKRTDLFRQKLTPEIKANQPTHVVEPEFSEDEIQDSQLKMMFAVCNPVLNTESQIALALRVLCGFGIDEVANALLSTKSTINKRLYRAKDTLRTHKVEMDLPAKEELDERLENVLSILYLLFNEGYYTTTHSEKVKKELCYEAMRLLHILTESENWSLPQCYALMALFCFHASRFDARTNELGELVLYEDQDKSKWEHELILQGEIYLRQSAKGNNMYKYHLEAMIAYWHTRTNVVDSKKWNNILRLYNRLLQIEYSASAALNRTYALYRVQGQKVALKEALKIKLQDNHLYHSLLAELYSESNPEKQKQHLEKSLLLAKSEQDINLIKRKLDRI